MASLLEQTTAQFAKLKTKNPAFAKQIDELLGSEGAAGAVADAVAVGKPAPNFSLPDAQGVTQTLSGLLSDGPVVLTFYRGGWCPYCNLQLQAMQARLDEIKALGATLVAVSAQTPDQSLTQVQRASLGFHVLSDQDAAVSSAYGVSWVVPELLIEHMQKDRGLDLEEINGGNGRVLSVPATFVMKRDGSVAWRYVNIDYRERAEPDAVLAALKALQD